MSRAVRVMWIDGQTRDGNGSRPTRLELRRDVGNEVLYRWYGQDYDEAGQPTGECRIDTEVSAPTVAEAVRAAEMSWGGAEWHLRA